MLILLALVVALFFVAWIVVAVAPVLLWIFGILFLGGVCILNISAVTYRGSGDEGWVWKAVSLVVVTLAVDFFVFGTLINATTNIRLG
jgi:hypothetical protein